MTHLRVLLVALALVASSIYPVSEAQAQGFSTVRINEFLASNVNGLVDNTGEFEDWIELHNSGGAAVDLAGWSLQAGDDTYAFAPGFNVAAGEYLVLFASGDVSRTTASELHLPFKLSADGEALMLRDSAGTLTEPSWPGAYPAQLSDVSSGVASSEVRYFDVPTPGGANPSDGLAGVVEPVSFSIDAGFYTAAFPLGLDTATPSSSVRYTLDGSTPSATNGTVLTPGTTFEIDQTSVVRAVALRAGWVPSKVETRSFIFIDDVLQQAAEPLPGWPAHNTVNQHYLDYEMDPNVVQGNEASVSNALRSLPTLSLVTDIEHLFDGATGIYVNPTGRGREWERPVSVELIDPSGQQSGFAIEGGIRIRGGSSRSRTNPKHSFRLYFRDSYEGTLEYPLFGQEGVDSFGRIDLRAASQHENWAWREAHLGTFVEDVWSRDTQGAMGQPYTRTRQYHLYINGLYWGLYMTQERVGGDYAEDYFGGNESDYDIIKRDSTPPAGSVGLPNEAVLGSTDAWYALYPLVADGVVTTAEFTEIAAAADLENLADYYLLQYYSAEHDNSPTWYAQLNRQPWVHSNNWWVLRNRTGTGPAGKWQFFDHDSEVILCQNQSSRLLEADSIDNTAPWPLREGVDQFASAGLHQGLLSHPAYRRVFADRVQRHMIDPGGALTIAEAVDRYDARVAEISPAIDAESARWGDGNPSFSVAVPGDPSITVLGRTQWEAAVAAERQCIVDRWDVTRTQLIEDDLWPIADPPAVQPDGGAVAFGTAATVSAAGATIWFTTDGSDPLGPDGTPVATASLYAGPISITSGTTVRARSVDAGVWSALAEAEFTLSAPPNPPKILLNEFNAVSGSNFLGGGTAVDVANGVDTVLGRVVGNGGDWFELVVLEDRLDVRGWAVEVWDDDGGVQSRSARLVFGDAAELAELRAGTLITISESLADDVSYSPQTGDWHINLQSNDAGDGAFITNASQSDFAINNDDTRIALFDGGGDPEALLTGEGTVPGVSVSSTEVFKFEGAPNQNVGPDNSLYNDGTSSSWGQPNLFGGGVDVQDLSGLRIDFGDTNCDASAGIVDALLIAQFGAGNRTDASCPLPNPATQLNAAAGDVNDDGRTDVIDGLLIAQCEVGINNIFCP